MIGYPTLHDRKTWTNGVRHLRKRDVKLARLMRKVGPFEFDGGESKEEGPYEFLVASIVYQQIAGNAARAILGRFKGLYDDRYPTPREYLATPLRKLRRAGLSPQKISYIKDLSRRVVKGELDLNQLIDAGDDEIIQKLDEVRGIGRWTAEMFLIFALHRVNVLPFDDLGIRKSIKRTYRLRSEPSREKMDKLRKLWSPYSSVATLYLWRSIAPTPVKP